MVKRTFLEMFDEDQHTILEYYLMGIFLKCTNAVIQCAFKNQK